MDFITNNHAAVRQSPFFFDNVPIAIDLSKTFSSSLAIYMMHHPAACSYYLHLLRRHLLLLVLLSALCATTTSADADEFIYNGFSGAVLSMDDQGSVIGDGLLRLTYGMDTLLGNRALVPVPDPFNTEK
jgi:hypothetical protein